MTNRSLYARAASALRLVGLLLAGAGAAAPAAAQPPCAACVVPEVTAEQAARFPDRLADLDVLVRVAPGREQDALPVLSAVAARGGRPGLTISGMPDRLPEASILARAFTVLVDASRETGAVPQLVFTLKRLLSSIRGAAPPTARIGVAVSAAQLPILARDLAPYVDFVAADAGVAAPTNVAVWQLLRAGSVADVSTAAAKGDALRWIWRLTGDPAATQALLAELTRELSPDAFAESVQVVGTRALTVEEIVARHQARAAKQAATVRELISSGTLTITFEAPGFAAPVTIGSETTIFTAAGRTDLEQRNIRVNGITLKGGGVPRLPIIEPERAAAPPLTITLTDVYRYRLAGEDVIDGLRAYVVAFEPADERANLFRGRAWIAADSFAMVKVAATQTGLRGAITSSEQIDEYRREAAGVWLLARSETRQLYEGAAHRTPITRVMTLTRHEINPADFTARRAAAYASSSVMLRDTPAGFRYLKREPRSAGAAVDQEPVVADAARRVRTIVGGVIIDPNISRPLPFAGVSYIDFDLFGTGTQFNAFFGGTYGQLAFSVPSLGGSRWQLAGRSFAIASSYNDRAFVGGREEYAHNIRQRPAHASVWTVRPVTPRMSVRAGYEMDYTHFARAPETAASFVVPLSQLVHGARLAVDFQHGGWAASAWWNPGRRQKWRAWGAASEYEPRHAGFQRYGASLTRATIVRPSVVTKLEAAWMAGHDLDRFSRYSFGTFDNRLRGYPSALIRYDAGAVARGAVAWAAAPLVRLDFFVDTAAVRDPGFSRRLRNYTGIGAALESPAPFGLLVGVEWGYGFRGVNANGRLGTHVIRVSAFKIF